MLDVGPLEILVILVVAVVVFGPERLPEFARQAARMLHTVRGFARNATSDLRSELGPGYQDMSLRDLDPRAMIRQHVMEAMADLDAEEREKDNASASPDPALPTGQVPPFDDEAT